MLMGGFILMTVWAVVFTIALSFEVDLTTYMSYILGFSYEKPCMYL